MMNQKHMRLLILGLLVSALLCGCGGKQTAPTESPETSGAAAPTETPGKTGPVKTGVNVLTGLPIEEESVNNRPIAVMLNNLKAALPQSGVSKADIIYEAPAEGGITRMLAVYQSVDGVGNIGSVRSTRSYYLDLVQGLDAILLHAGASAYAYQDIKSRGVTALDCIHGGGYEGTLYWRDKNRIKKVGYEHSVFTSGERIERLFPTYSFRKTHKTGYTYGMQFADDGTPAGGSDASRISVKFSKYKTGVFTYDPRTRLYKAAEYGAPYVDGGTGEQVAVTNVLVLKTGISVINGDTAGRLDVDLVGSGKGSFACGGKMVDILWRKASHSSPFVYTLTDGTPVVFGRGKSYVNIIGSGASVSVE